MCSTLGAEFPASFAQSVLGKSSSDQNDPAVPLQYQSGEDIRYTTEVGGFFKAVQLFKRFHRMADEQDLRSNCQGREQSLATQFAFLDDYLKNTVVGANYKKATGAHETLAQFLSYKGEMARAIDEFQAAYNIAADHQLTGGDLLRLRESLGIAEMRRAESDNCVHGHAAVSCIFPLRAAAQHKMTSGSERAIQHFLAYLQSAPDDLEVKWLLNIAYMTLGRYPQDVPAAHLIAPEAFNSEQDVGRFVDVAPALGLDAFQMAGGLIVDDFDNDGFLDVMMSSFDSCCSLRYFHNNGNGTFSDWTSKAGLSEQLGGLNIVQTDYNNDGLLDIFVMRGAWELPIRNSLLRNNGDGTFTDVTKEAGLAEPAFQTLSAAWADFDNDGYLDLFLGHENTPNQLFHNNGDGTFTDVARELKVASPTWSFPTWFFDYDNDGTLDLFVASYSFSLTEVVRSSLQRPVRSEALRLYKNLGNGTFRDATKEVGLDRVLMPMGSNFGDVDNDGYLDFYLGTGGPSYGSLVPNILFRNDKGKRFVDITTSSGTGHLQKGHAVAFADINNDGDQEIIAEIGGATPGDRYFSAVFKNPGNHGNNWITIKLVGVKTNRAAIGARLKVTVKDEDNRTREIYRWVTSGGSFGSSPLRQHIGVGKAQEIDAIEVWWPTTKTRQVFREIPVNSFVQIKEFDKAFTTLKHQSFVLPV